MASSSVSSNDEPPMEPFKLAKHGIALLINNQTTEAQDLFKSNSESIQMAAGYSFTAFMDALMSFEEEKLVSALTILRDTEKKCAGDIGWLKSVKTKMFGVKANTIADRLETQIILADIQVCVAILTFLQQEFSGYLKGGWVLRKAWKIYQQTYLEIVNLYKQKFGDFNLPDPTDFDWQDDRPMSRSSSVATTETDGPSCEWSIPDSTPSSPSPKRNRNGYAPISSPVPKSTMPHSQSSYVFSKSTGFFPFSIKRSGSAHSSLTNDGSNPVPNSRSAFSLLSPLSTHLSYLTSTLSLLTSPDKNQADDIEPEDISRLMGAVCFGYGVLQLGMSLLPSSLLKVTNFLGFHGNRSSGISNLMYARKGTDMRAPLATLALLWYHTIVRPFYALDGNNVKAGVEAANLLIQESIEEYEHSALFLFFRGRIHRLNSNIPQALQSFQAAVENSSQREIKLLALHEVGWCHLIQLDYRQAQRVFYKLKLGSRWSRAFYAFLSIICSGAINKKEPALIRELKDLYETSNPKSTQLDVFLQRRLKVFPLDEQALYDTRDMYWKFFVYELIYLWNALPSCSPADIEVIVKDCNETDQEPIPGLAMLIQGECHNILGSYENAVESLRNCILTRSQATPKDDIHVSAYAEYTLGVLLTKNPQTKEEGKQMLQHTASQYKDYDFDNKLHVRITMALKNVS